MKNPSDATWASLSILKYSKIQNGRQMAENGAKINIIHVVDGKKVTGKKVTEIKSRKKSHRKKSHRKKSHKNKGLSKCI